MVDRATHLVVVEVYVAVVPLLQVTRDLTDSANASLSDIAAVTKRTTACLFLLGVLVSVHLVAEISLLP